MTKQTYAKKSYTEPPEIEILLCEQRDIISTSGGTGTNDSGAIRKTAKHENGDIFYR